MKNTAEILKQTQEHLRAGRAGQARAPLLRALSSARGPEAAALSVAMSHVAMAEQLGEQALYYANQAATLSPNDPEMFVNLANVQGALGSGDTAIETAAAAVAKFPSVRNTHATLLNLYLRADRFADVMHGCKTAMVIFPTDAPFAMTYATMLLSLGKPEEAVGLLRELVKREPKNIRAWGSLCPALNYAPDVDPAEHLNAHRTYGRLLAEMLPPRQPGKGSGGPDSERPLRLGFVSPDLRTHPVRFFIEPVLEHLDTKSFTITCYFTGGTEDAESTRLKSLVPTWKHVPTLNIGELADVIARDGIDILIDLAGHTRFDRLGTMHLRPAPVQMNYIGYPCTTGVVNTDYHLTDTLSSPASQEPMWTERLLRVDPAFFAYKPVADPPPVAPPPMTKNGYVTFGSFNTLMKLNDQVVRAWTRIVLSVPRSRLVIKNVQLMQEEARRLTRDRFVSAGLPADRLDVLGHTGTPHDHLATYERLDIGLDTFPYAGMTTTLESLLMGVPVISLAQQTHASRVGLSILAHVGLRELVVENEAKFVEAACKLAGEPKKLQSLRASLRGTLLASVLCDGSGFGKKLSESLRETWRVHCSGAKS